MAEYEFMNPDFVEGNTEEEIHERMMASLPADIDDMPGGFPYDFTMPVAIEKAEIINFIIPRTLMIMFPQFAWGDWLDLHGMQCGLKRREATKSTGYVKLKGEDGVEIAVGTVFCTPATNTNSSIEFESTEAVVVAEGSAKVPIRAIQAGNSSNVAAGTITLALKPITGINNIVNELTQYEQIVMLCGHYEGFDERIREIIKPKEISLGDFVLTGGEIAALAIIDSVARFLPGVLGNEASAQEDSFNQGLLEYPQYTRPREFRGQSVPDILLSGDHQKIAKWRREQALRVTKERRPDLLQKADLTEEDKTFLNRI